MSDRGRGIPAEDLPGLFRKFSRREDQDTGGDTCLGLANCKGIVEAHGDGIRAESDGPGLGARFTFTLPMAETETGASVATSSGTRRQNRGKVRVWAVDDDPQALRCIRDVLTRAGYAPIATGDPGRRAPP